MKRLALPFFLCLLLAACSFPKEAEYRIPEKHEVKDRKDFLAQYKEGHSIYQTRCAACHTKEVDGKKVEPRFLPLQLESYLIRLKPHEHRPSLTKETLTDLEIKKVFVYLLNNHVKEDWKKSH
ncbi:MAG: cytochrome c [Bacteroidia bacterium]|nr:cytochrome c [Bacteroidia bacterium]